MIVDMYCGIITASSLGHRPAPAAQILALVCSVLHAVVLDNLWPVGSTSAAQFGQAETRNHLSFSQLPQAYVREGTSTRESVLAPACFSSFR
jgi:hypothetical protein